MKIVTMCQGGHVRSVGLKFILRYTHGHDVIACGWEGNTDETRAMLFAWADVIIIMEKHFEQYVPSEHHNHADGRRKLFCYDVGPDRFGSPFHPELQQILNRMISEHGLLTKKMNIIQSPEEEPENSRTSTTKYASSFGKSFETTKNIDWALCCTISEVNTTSTFVPSYYQYSTAGNSDSTFEFSGTIESYPPFFDVFSTIKTKG